MLYMFSVGDLHAPRESRRAVIFSALALALVEQHKLSTRVQLTSHGVRTQAPELVRVLVTPPGPAADGGDTGAAAAALAVLGRGTVLRHLTPAPGAQ